MQVGFWLFADFPPSVQIPSMLVHSIFDRDWIFHSHRFFEPLLQIHWSLIGFSFQITDRFFLDISGNWISLPWNDIQGKKLNRRMIKWYYRRDSIFLFNINGNLLTNFNWHTRWYQKSNSYPGRCDWCPFAPAVARVRHRWPNDTIRPAALGNSVTKRDFSLEHCPHLRWPVPVSSSYLSSRTFLVTCRIVRERPCGIAVPLAFCNNYSKLLRRYDVLSFYYSTQTQSDILAKDCRKLLKITILRNLNRLIKKIGENWQERYWFS